MFYARTQSLELYLFWCKYTLPPSAMRQAQLVYMELTIVCWQVLANTLVHMQMDLVANYQPRQSPVRPNHGCHLAVVVSELHADSRQCVLAFLGFLQC